MSTTAKTGPNFGLNDEQLEMQSVVRKFTADEIIPVAAHHDRTGEYPWDIIRKAWKLGLMNVHIPADIGGLDLSCVTGSIIAEEMSYGCAGIQVAMKVSEVGVRRRHLHKSFAEPRAFKFLCCPSANARGYVR